MCVFLWTFPFIFRPWGSRRLITFRTCGRPSPSYPYMPQGGRWRSRKKSKTQRERQHLPWDYHTLCHHIIAKWYSTSPLYQICAISFHEKNNYFHELNKCNKKQWKSAFVINNWDSYDDMVYVSSGRPLSSCKWNVLFDISQSSVQCVFWASVSGVFLVWNRKIPREIKAKKPKEGQKRNV